MRSDNVLLEHFTARRDEAAFAALVRRYGPLVLGICRRVPQHEHDAEDAFQAVFCVLARKAGTLHPDTAVGAWLHTVTYRVARKAKAIQVRRHMRETDLPDIPAPDHPPEWLWRELRPVLDEEVSRLPEHFRIALDQWGNTASTYTGTAHFSSTDLFAQLPDDTSFSGADAGAHTVTVTLETPGTQAIGVVDTRSASIAGSVTADVTAGFTSPTFPAAYWDLSAWEADGDGWHPRPWR